MLILQHEAWLIDWLMESLNVQGWLCALCDETTNTTTLTMQSRQMTSVLTARLVSAWHPFQIWNIPNMDVTGWYMISWWWNHENSRRYQGWNSHQPPFIYLRSGMSWIFQVNAYRKKTQSCKARFSILRRIRDCFLKEHSAYGCGCYRTDDKPQRKPQAWCC